MCGTWYDVNNKYLSYPRYIHLGNTYKSGSSITVVSCQLTSATGTLYEHHKAIKINTSSFINLSTYNDHYLANLTKEYPGRNTHHFEYVNLIPKRLSTQWGLHNEGFHDSSWELARIWWLQKLTRAKLNSSECETNSILLLSFFIPDAVMSQSYL